MIYVDASILLRRVLREPGELEPRALDDDRVSSVLTEVECLRSLDRLHQAGRLSVNEAAAARTAAFGLLGSIQMLALTPAIMRQAGEPLPTPLGTLDALHLASALGLADEAGPEPVRFATHDRELARCARACGLEVVGA